MISPPSSQDVDYDVVIVGAGISGINFAHRLQERNPNLKYCILEARDEIGGTWSLFQYPGIRSDSDLYTFGFAWRPWRQKQAIAQGSLIAEYLKESAKEDGSDKKIKFNHHVKRMLWSTSSKTWSIYMDVKEPEVVQRTLQTRFVMLGTGYYDYTTPMHAEIPGIETYQGTLVHPQFWPSDLDYSNKNVVIIGSGATAITILPAVAQTASHVTMLQRSPSYIVSVPSQDKFEKISKFLLPSTLAAPLIRFKWILTSFLLVSFCQWFPKLSREIFRRETKKQLPKGVSLDPDFNPSYGPWQQRMCVCPDGDFYKCLREGKGSIKTGVIDTITASTIRLKSGDELHPDIIVTATGLKLRVGGGIEIVIDGKPYNIADHFAWKGAMLEGLPNVVLALGYVDASWTLGADATAKLACRFLNQMGAEGVNMIVPWRSLKEKECMKEVPFLSLTSTYVQRGRSGLPKAGDMSQWLPRSYYWKDLFSARWGDIKKGMEWSK